jgi:hypothetical protein
MFITICRLYETYPDAAQAVASLQAMGVPAEDISLISNNSDNWFKPTEGGASEDTAADANREEAKREDANSEEGKSSEPDARTRRIEGGLIGAAIGATAGTAGSLSGSLMLLAIPGIGAVAGAGWLLAMMAAGAAVGAASGGLLGALTSAGVSEQDAHVYAEGVRRGGSLVTARVPSDKASQTEDAMDGGAVDIQQRGSDYRQSGWRAFDPAAEPYSADDVRTERHLHQAA